MLEYINGLLDVYSSFVSMFFTLPFYDSVSVGWVIVAIAVIGFIIHQTAERIVQS